MKKIIIYSILLVLSTACSRSEIEEIPNQPKKITQIRANIASDKNTRVLLDVDPNTSDKTYWKEGDFLFVAELSEGNNLFTGHILRYNYIPPVPAENQSRGSFNGVGMVTGGKYLIVNTNISYLFIGLPQMGDSFFECTFKNTFYCNASFGENAVDVQQIADQLLFIGTTTILDSDQEPNISLSSPMSMIELRLTADNITEKVEKITIESADEFFSYKIYADRSGESQSANVSNNYHWQKLNSEVVFTAGHYPLLSDSKPLKVRVPAFQKVGTLTSLKIKVLMDDGSTLSYDTPPQSQTLQPNVVTVINAHLLSP